MAQPQAYNRATDFTQRDGDDTDHAAINAELDAAALSINQVRANMALLQKDDGTLANKIVGADQLAPSAFDAVAAQLAEATQDAQDAASSATIAASTAISARDTAVTAKDQAVTANNASQLNAQSAASSASAASASESSAAASALAADADRVAAQAAASTAATQAGIATTQAGTATTQAGIATTQAGIATTQAGIAATQASNASSSASAALASAAAAASSYDAFDDRYLGAKASDPTVDNDGNALLTGALYWNTARNEMRVYSGSSWSDVAKGVDTYQQTFSGTGSQTSFTLTNAPYSVSSTEVFISGVRQVPLADYTVSGTALTFVAAPPAGTGNIFVRWTTLVEPATIAANALAAQTSATNAAGSASAALTSANSAANSASAALTSANSASTSAATATTQAGIATTQAGIATTQAGIATTQASSAATSATSASNSASTAAASATAAQGYLAPVVATSTTSLTLGAGARSLTVNTGKPFAPGMPIKISRTSAPTASYMTGTVISYNSGTGVLVASIDTVEGSGTFTDWTVTLQGGGSGAGLATKILRAQFLTEGTTYTPAADVAEFYALVYGATGGVSGASLGGIGGPGYSEKYYPSPSGSYSYSIGAGGTNAGTAGGTTAFDVISVTGSGGVTTTTGSAGGVGSGGDFNASGGKGGDRLATGYGGCGGAGSRAGNGGDGGDSGSSSGQGGTGGNNASGTTAGAGATSRAVGSLDIPWGDEVFLSGRKDGSVGGAQGVPVLSTSFASSLYLLNNGLHVIPTTFKSPGDPSTYGVHIKYPNARYSNGAIAGVDGLITIIEVLK